MDKLKDWTRLLCIWEHFSHPRAFIKWKTYIVRDWWLRDEGDYNWTSVLRTWGDGLLKNDRKDVFEVIKEDVKDFAISSTERNWNPDLWRKFIDWGNNIGAESWNKLTWRDLSVCYGINKWFFAVMNYWEVSNEITLKEWEEKYLWDSAVETSEEYSIWDEIVITNPVLAREAVAQCITEWKIYKVIGVKNWEPRIIDDQWDRLTLDSKWWYHKVSEEYSIWDEIVITNPVLAREGLSEYITKWKIYKVVGVVEWEPTIIEEEWYQLTLDSKWWYHKVGEVSNNKKPKNRFSLIWLMKWDWVECVKERSGLTVWNKYQLTRNWNWDAECPWVHIINDNWSEDYYNHWIVRFKPWDIAPKLWYVKINNSHPLSSKFESWFKSYGWDRVFTNWWCYWYWYDNQIGKERIISRNKKETLDMHSNWKVKEITYEQRDEWYSNTALWWKEKMFKEKTKEEKVQEKVNRNNTYVKNENLYVEILSYQEYEKLMQAYESIGRIWGNWKTPLRMLNTYNSFTSKSLFVKFSDEIYQTWDKWTKETILLDEALIKIWRIKWTISWRWLKNVMAHEMAHAVTQDALTPREPYGVWMDTILKTTINPFNNSKKTNTMSKLTTLITNGYFTKAIDKKVVKLYEEGNEAITKFQAVRDLLDDIIEWLQDDVADLKSAYDSEDIRETKQEIANVEAKIKDVKWSKDLTAICMIGDVIVDESVKWTGLWDLVPKRK